MRTCSLAVFMVYGEVGDDRGGLHVINKVELKRMGFMEAHRSTEEEGGDGR
jgi:hypothetical protein